jgi:hypothetical protein
MPAPVRPMVVPAPSAGTTQERGTSGTISRSAAITASQPPPTAVAAARLCRSAYRTRDRFAVSPYPTSPSAKVASAIASWRASAAWLRWDWKTRASGTQLPAMPATPSQDATITVRVEVAQVASKLSVRAESSGNALVATGTASTA